MRFFEYEARKIVELAGIPVTKYGFCTTPEEARAAAEEIGGPVVIKSQVLTGGRMKAGGVKFADTPDEAAAHAEAILKLEINGHMPRGVLVDPKAEVKQEYYAGVVWDGTAKKPLMLFSDMGGIDIEEVAETHPDHVGRGHFSNLFPIAEFEAKQAIAATGVSGRALTRATPILSRLAGLFRDNDMTLAEINPLAELTDAVRNQGGKPANYSEIGGNPSVAKACGLAKEVLEKDGVEKIAVMMSIVSNTRVDIVARGVIKACLELGKDPGETIAIFRIPGAWEDEGFKILERYGVEYCDRSVSMWEAAGRAVAKVQGAAA